MVFDMKREYTIVLIKILKWITLGILGVITIGMMMFAFADTTLLQFIWELNINKFLLKSAIYLFLALILITPIPYIIISIYIGSNILIKYIKQKRNIVKTVVLSCLLILLTLIILRCMPYTEYIVKVNSKVDNIANIEISELVKKDIKDNSYITYIEITPQFFEGYTVKINYFDKWFGTQTSSYSGNPDEFDFSNILDNYAVNITFIKNIISIILLITMIIIYIYFCKYIINEYKILANIESSKNEEKYNLIRNYSLITLLVIFLVLGIIYVISKNIKIPDNTPIANNVQEDITNNDYLKDPVNKELMNWMFEDNSGISIKYQGSWSGKDIITFDKTIDGGKTYIIQNPNGFDVHYGWKAVFINSDIGFINDSENGEKSDFYVTHNSGKTFEKVNLSFSNISEKNCFIDELPYYEDGILKLKVYEVDGLKNYIYYEFYSEDNGLNWKLIE